jgi:glycosyltransferase involved in cell wall biosynthesis
MHACRKDTLYAAKAARRLALHRPEIKWAFLCRNSPEFEIYKRDIRRTLDGVSGVNTFDTQSPKELARFLNAGDVILFPSLLEAVSIAALEAMACSRLIISTSVGGMGEILTNGKNSLLIPERDERAIVRALIHVSDDHSHCQCIAEEGHKLVNDNYRWRSVAERTLSNYQKILSNPVVK